MKIIVLDIYIILYYKIFIKLCNKNLYYKNEESEPLIKLIKEILVTDMPKKLMK